MIPLLLDQGLSRSTAHILRQAGFDIIHVGECGLSAAADSEILEYARREAPVICTLDADFHALLALSGASAPSVIRLRREGLRGPEVAALLESVLPRIEGALKAGATVSVTERDLRFRNLPLVVLESGG